MCSPDRPLDSNRYFDVHDIASKLLQEVETNGAPPRLYPRGTIAPIVGTLHVCPTTELMIRRAIANHVNGTVYFDSPKLLGLEVIREPLMVSMIGSMVYSSSEIFHMFFEKLVLDEE